MSVKCVGIYVSCILHIWYMCICFFMFLSCYGLCICVYDAFNACMCACIHVCEYVHMFVKFEINAYVCKGGN